LQSVDTGERHVIDVALFASGTPLDALVALCQPLGTPVGDLPAGTVIVPVTGGGVADDGNASDTSSGSGGSTTGQSTGSKRKAAALASAPPVSRASKRGRKGVHGGAAKGKAAAAAATAAAAARDVPVAPTLSQRLSLRGSTARVGPFARQGLLLSSLPTSTFPVPSGDLPGDGVAVTVPHCRSDHVYFGNTLDAVAPALAFASQMWRTATQPPSPANAGDGIAADEPMTEPSGKPALVTVDNVQVNITGLSLGGQVPLASDKITIRGVTRHIVTTDFDAAEAIYKLLTSK